METRGSAASEVVLRVERGRRLGVAFDDVLHVTQVDPSVILSGSLRPGDTIAALDGTPVRSKSQLHGLINRRLAAPNPQRQSVSCNVVSATDRRSHGPTPTNTLYASSTPSSRIDTQSPTSAATSAAPPSPTSTASVVSVSNSLSDCVGGILSPALLAAWGGNPELIPSAWEPLITRRAGFRYLAILVDWPRQPQRHLGITLSFHSSSIVVSGLSPGSLGADALRLLDRLLLVNGTRVRSEDQAKNLMLGSGGHFLVVVERGETPVPAAPPSLRLPINAEGDDDAEPTLPRDAVAIAELQRQRHRQNLQVKPKGIFRSAAPATTAPVEPTEPVAGPSRVAIRGRRATQVPIPSDQDPAKTLQHIHRNPE